MGALDIVLAILLFVSAIFLIVAVLMQSGKDKGTGVITGGSSETYFGKNKGKSKEKKLALLTTIVAIVFIVLAILAFVLQEKPVEVPTTPGTSSSANANGATDTSKPASSATADSSATANSSTDSSK